MTEKQLTIFPEVQSKVIHGDCLEVMRTMEDNSIDFIVTDPPYGLKFMDKQWDHGVPGKEFWEEALRICKPGSWLAAFGGTRTFHRLTCAIEDAEWEIRDCIMWLYGSGFPKGKGCLKPAWEPIILARKGGCKVSDNFLNIDECRIGNSKPNCKNTPFESWRKLENRDDRQIPNQTYNPSEGRWPANLILDEEAGELLDQQMGNEVSRFFKKVDQECFLCNNTYTKAKVKECNHTPVKIAELYSKNTKQITENTVQENALINQEEQFVQNVKFAENLCDLCATNIVRGLVEIKNSDFKTEELQVTLDYIGNYKKCILIQNLVSFAELWVNTDTIPTIQSLYLLFGSVRHAIENYTNQENHNLNGKKEKLRFLYHPKASPSERNSNLEDLPLKQCKTGCGGDMPVDDKGKQRDRFKKLSRNNHPTVKPLSLMKYIIKLLAPPGNPILLDPFAGSCSTLVAAKELGISSIGIEKEAEYVEIAKVRLK